MGFQKKSQVVISGSSRYGAAYPTARTHNQSNIYVFVCWNLHTFSFNAKSLFEKLSVYFHRLLFRRFSSLNVSSFSTIHTAYPTCTRRQDLTKRKCVCLLLPKCDECLEEGIHFLESWYHAVQDLLFLPPPVFVYGLCADNSCTRHVGSITQHHKCTAAYSSMEEGEIRNCMHWRKCRSFQHVGRNTRCISD
jgi:hypothetical protein